MITQQLLQEVFAYRDGSLYWLKHHMQQDQYPGGSRSAGSRAGCTRRSGYRYVFIGGKAYLEHRLIYLFHHGVVPKYVDHINSDKCDNRVENLRECTASQSLYNTRRRSASGVKGVYWNKRGMRWYAQLKIDKKRLWVGSFTSLEDAEAAIKAAREKYHGAFCNHGTT